MHQPDDGGNVFLRCHGAANEQDGAGTTNTDSWDVSGSLPLLLEETAGSTTTDYVYGPGGQVLEQIQAGTTVWYHHDLVGSTRALTDASGTVQRTFQFDPYGNVVASTGTATTPFQYTGQYRDAETGLYYLRARYYDPTTAQFLTVDPLVAKTRSPYAYVAGNPLNATDPSGQCVWIGCNVADWVNSTGHCVWTPWGSSTDNCQQNVDQNIQAVQDTPVLGAALRFDPALALFEDTAKAASGDNVSPWQFGVDVVGVAAFPAGGLAQGLSKLAGFGAGEWSAAVQLWNNRNVINWGWTAISKGITHGTDIWSWISSHCGA